MTEPISIREFARRAGCDDQVVRRKIKSGHLPTLAGGKLDAAHLEKDWRAGAVMVSAQPQLADGEVDVAAALQKMMESGEALLSKADAERVKENYAALLKQLEYDRQAGAVAEIDDVVVAVASEFSLVRNKLLNIGSRVAPRIAVMRAAEEIKALIDAEVVLALEELTIDGHGETDFDRLRESVQARFGPAS